MAVGESPAVARHRLRRALREAREAKGLTQRQVSKALEWSLSKVNRIEAGDVTVSNTDLQALLGLLEITEPDRVQQLTDEGRVSRRRGWWDEPEYRDHLTPAMVQQLQFEMEASAIRSFQPTLIPGPVQTPAYATALMQFWNDELSEADRAVRIEVRRRRRDQLLRRTNPAEYLVVLDESVLLREVGGPQVMSEQLYEMLEFIRAGRMIVRVVPLTHATPFAAYGLFTLYAADDSDMALYWENPRALHVDEITTDPESIHRHRQFFEQAWRHAFNEEASMHRIEARAALLRSAADRHPDG